MSNMVINTNVPALNAHRSMKNVGLQQFRASQRLSSGLRINSAADDAAGLAISEKMRAQIAGLDQASKNAQDAVSLIQTAEGGMEEIGTMVRRIRDLIVYASNDTQEHNSQGTGDRQKIQDEIDQLVQEIDSMADRVEFNKKTLIDGSFAPTLLNPATQVALDAAQAAFDIQNINFLAAQADVDDALNAVVRQQRGFLNFLNDDKFIKAIDELKNATHLLPGTVVTDITDLETDVIAARKELEALIASPNVTDWTAFLATEWADVTTAVGLANTGVTAAGSNANTTDLTNMATVNSMLTSTVMTAAITTAYGAVGTGGLLDAEDKLITAAGTWATAYAAFQSARATLGASPKEDRLYFQIGANAHQGLTFSINSLKTNALGIGDGRGNATIVNVLYPSGKDITGLLDVMDDAISYVNTERSRLGAAQNRLEHTMKSLDITSENLTASESRIRDADMAKEMMNLTKTNVLQQAATSMLAQANQAPQNILQLLR